MRESAYKEDPKTGPPMSRNSHTAAVEDMDASAIRGVCRPEAIQ